MALIALVLLTVPWMRPGVFTRGICWLGACMSFPMTIGYGFHSDGLITVAFALKPIAATVSATLFLGYIFMFRGKNLPLATFVPSVVLLCGSIVDVLAVIRLGIGWGGAGC